MKFKKKNVLIILIILICISAAIFLKEINSLDEIWNFNFAKNIVDKKIPYKDFNMITTPLLPMISALFLMIFGTELIVIRLLAILLCTSIFYMVYKILDMLDVSKMLINIFMILLYILYFEYFTIDYNFATLFIILVVLYHELKKVKQTSDIVIYDFKYDIIMGILIGLTITLKQTTGIIISTIFILYKIFLVHDKDTLKKVLKIMGIRTLGVVIPVLIFIYYLVSNNIWNEFIDYAIYGVVWFDNVKNYSYLFKYINLLIRGLAYLVPVVFLYMFYINIQKKVNTREKKNIFILFFYSLACFSIVFPISDGIHFIVGALPCFISMVYIIWNFYTTKRTTKLETSILQEAKKVINLSTIGFIIGITIYAFSIMISFIINANNYLDIKHFNYIKPREVFEINKVGEYILKEEEKGNKVYILDSSAALYMIPIDHYNKDYDMFLKGNLGSKTYEEQIQLLQEQKNIIILTLNQPHPKNWQIPIEITNHIEINWQKIGEIERFSIYERK